MVQERLEPLIVDPELFVLVDIDADYQVSKARLELENLNSHCGTVVDTVVDVVEDAVVNCTDMVTDSTSVEAGWMSLEMQDLCKT